MNFAMSILSRLGVPDARLCLIDERPRAGRTNPSPTCAVRGAALGGTAVRALSALALVRVSQRREVRVVAAAFWRHIQHIPDRPDGVDMAGPQTLGSRRIHQLRSPRMAELITVADEHVQDRHLLAFWGFRVVVAVVGVASRG